MHNTSSGVIALWLSHAARITLPFTLPFSGGHKVTQASPSALAVAQEAHTREGAGGSTQAVLSSLST